MRIALLQPDLNLKSSDLLLLNIIQSLQHIGCEVKLFTSNLDTTHLKQLNFHNLDTEQFNSFLPYFQPSAINSTNKNFIYHLYNFINSIIMTLYLVLFGGGFNIVIIRNTPGYVLLLPLLRLRFKV